MEVARYIVTSPQWTETLYLAEAKALILPIEIKADGPGSFQARFAIHDLIDLDGDMVPACVVPAGTKLPVLRTHDRFDPTMALAKCFTQTKLSKVWIRYLYMPPSRWLTP